MATVYIQGEEGFICDYTERKKGWLMNNMHYHTTYELFVMVSGKTAIMSEDNIFKLQRGDVVLFRKNALHKNNGGTDHGRYTVNFSDKYLREHFTQSAAEELLGCFEYDKIIVPRRYQGYAFALLRRMEQKGSEFAFLSAFLGMLKDCVAEMPVKAEKVENDINIVLEYINENFKSIEKIDEIAEAAHTSKSYLCQKFKRCTGMTVTEYLNSVRIKNACEMLGSGNMNVSETAQECGYSTSAYFCKVFREIVKMTPSEFRRFEI